MRPCQDVTQLLAQPSLLAVVSFVRHPAPPRFDPRASSPLLLGGAETEAERAARLARAAEWHAQTEQGLRPPQEETIEEAEAEAPPRAAGARVLGERPWVGRSTVPEAADDLRWEPMAPPERGPRAFGIPSNQANYVAVFGVLALYALVGAAGYTGAALALGEALRALLAGIT